MINRPVSLKVEQVIAEKLNPLILPTSTATPTVTYTPTPGPSLTYTSSPTATSTPTATPTVTSSPTPTHALAQIQTAGLPKLQLYQSPDGPVIGQLRHGQWLTILYGRQEYEGIVWVEVMDEEGRTGWLPEIYLQPAMLTPKPWIVDFHSLAFILSVYTIPSWGQNRFESRILDPPVNK